MSTLSACFIPHSPSYQQKCFVTLHKHDVQILRSGAGASAQHGNASLQEYMSYFFVSVFALEVVLTILAVGLNAVLTHFWYAFDFYIAVLSILSIAATRFINSSSAFANSISILRVVRMMRIFRALRLFRFLSITRHFQVTAMTIVNSLANSLPFLVVIFFFFYLYGYFGMYLFSSTLVLNNATSGTPWGSAS